MIMNIAARQAAGNYLVFACRFGCFGISQVRHAVANGYLAVDVLLFAVVFGGVL